MRLSLRFVLCCALWLSFVSAAAAQGGSKSKAFHTEGLFGNIAAGEGGDYSGMQIYLTDADGQFYATVTVAEGVLLPPVLVKVRAQVEARTIEFELPGEGGGRKFKGTVAANGLTLWEGDRKTFLKRTCLD
jgi:hypothetical protein